MSKSKFGLAFCIIIIGLLLYSLYSRWLDPFLDVNNINSKDITSIKIYDRGIFGNDSVVVDNKDELRLISRLIISSNKVEHSTLNIRASHGLCELELWMKNNDKFTIVLIKTSFSGGILNSGNFYYRNDSLLSVVSEKLKPE